ncbi:MAG: TRAP transporter TatT component family protein, partial [Myxococcota bacterium]
MTADRKRIAALMLVTAAGLTGCDLTRFTANSTAGLFERASSASEGMWDYELAGDALPASIMQLEGLLRVVPDNEIYLSLLVKAYVAYGYGWVEDEALEADARGDYLAYEAGLDRAKLLYLRARDVAQHQMGLHAEGMDERIRQGLEPFETWLKRNFRDREDAEMLLWAGYAWGSAINSATNDMALVADLPFARALVERSVALDPEYEYAAGITFLAVVEAESLGGDLD